MTTTIRNGRHTAGINAFRLSSLPINPLPFLYSAVDCIKEQGTDWLSTDEGKALLFPVLQLAYGPTFQLDSVTEHARLDQAIPRK